jgi:hypothetical protein
MALPELVVRLAGGLSTTSEAAQGNHHDSPGTYIRSAPGRLPSAAANLRQDSVSQLLDSAL